MVLNKFSLSFSDFSKLKIKLKEAEAGEKAQTVTCLENEVHPQNPLEVKEPMCGGMCFHLSPREAERESLV